MTDIISLIPQLKSQGKSFVLCLITGTEGSTPRKAGARMIVFPDRNIVGTIGGGVMEYDVISDALKVLEEGRPDQKTYARELSESSQEFARVSIYFEPFRPDIKLYIFGAGHVGRETAQYATDLGFRVTIIDPRSDVLSTANIPGVHLVNEEYTKSAKEIVFSPEDFIVITTHSHESDHDLVELLSPKSLAYIGMIGSTKKVADTRKKMLESKKLSKEQLDKVDMPIGIPIKAETPKEVALSIAARLIDVKNNLPEKA